MAKTIFDTGPFFTFEPVKEVIREDPLFGPQDLSSWARAITDDGIPLVANPVAEEKKKDPMIYDIEDNPQIINTPTISSQNNTQNNTEEQTYQTEQVTRRRNPGQLFKMSEAGYNAGPYQGLSAYRISPDTLVNITKEQLEQYDEGNSVTIKPLQYGNKTEIRGRLSNRTNNPLNISHYSDDIGFVNQISADGRNNFGVYASVVDGLASGMKLLKRRYNHKSIRTINTSGYQGGRYSRNEDKGLSNLRLVWISNISQSMGVDPTQKLNLDDKETMFAFVQAMAKQESISTFTKDDLEKAWKKAFG